MYLLWYDQLGSVSNLKLCMWLELRWLIGHHGNCKYDSDSQHCNIVTVADEYYEHAQLKESRLTLTNSSDSNCVGRQNSNDRRNTTLDYIEGSIGKAWEHL